MDKRMKRGHSQHQFLAVDGQCQAIRGFFAYIGRQDRIQLAIDQHFPQLIGVSLGNIKRDMGIPAFKMRIQLCHGLNTPIGRNAQPQSHRFTLFHTLQGFKRMTLQFQNLPGSLKINLSSRRRQILPFAAEKELQAEFSLQLIQIFAECLLGYIQVACRSRGIALGDNGQKIGKLIYIHETLQITTFCYMIYNILGIVNPYRAPYNTTIKNMLRHKR